MNSKEAKRYRKKAKALTVDWIKSLIPDEEGKKVNIDNFKDYMPDQNMSMQIKSLCFQLSPRDASSVAMLNG